MRNIISNQGTMGDLLKYESFATDTFEIDGEDDSLSVKFTDRPTLDINQTYDTVGTLLEPL